MADQIVGTDVRMVECFNQHWYKVTTGTGKDRTFRMIPSVTTKLNITDKPFLARWRGDIGNREADMRLFEAQERGSRIHHGWYTLTTGGVILYNPWQKPNYTDEEIKSATEKALGNLVVVRYQDEMLALIKLQSWVEEVKPDFLFAEKTVYSLSQNDAGTIDNAMYIKEGDYNVNGVKKLHIPEGRYIVDLKTGNQVGDSAYQQTAAYLKISEEMGHGPFVGTIILHTSSSNKGAIEGLATKLSLMPDVEQEYKKYRVASQMWELNNPDAAPKVFEFPALIKLNGGSNETRKTAG